MHAISYHPNHVWAFFFNRRFDLYSLILRTLQRSISKKCFALVLKKIQHVEQLNFSNMPLVAIDEPFYWWLHLCSFVILKLNLFLWPWNFPVNTTTNNMFLMHKCFSNMVKTKFQKKRKKNLNEIKYIPCE
jgi:hypothetical protein